MNNQVELDSKTQQVLEEANIIASGEEVLAQLGIDSTIVKAMKEGIKRSSYRAVINWLTKYKANPDASNLKKVKGLLDSFYHLCEVEDWEKSSSIFLNNFQLLNNKSLNTQLHSWGHHIERLDLNYKILGQLNHKVDIICLRNLGNSSMILGEHNKAINFYEKCLFLTQKMGDKLNECLTLRSLSNFYFSRGDYSQAINFSEKLLTLCELVQESKTKIETLINLAGSHYFLGKTEKAAILFEQCLTDIQILENQPTKVYLLGTIGNIYDFMQEYSKAIDCYQKSLSIAQIINYQQTGGILANLGKTIMKLEQYPEALDILFKAIEQLKKDGIRIGESISILNVAEIYYQLGYIDLALNYYNQALEIAMNLENPQLLEQCKEFNSRLLQF